MTAFDMFLASPSPPGLYIQGERRPGADELGMVPWTSGGIFKDGMKSVPRTGERSIQTIL